MEEMARLATNKESRDPKDMNNYLQLLWEDIVAEPEGIRSSDCVWRSAFKVYRCSLSCCYGLLTLIFAIPIAFCVGINFACLAFEHIWCLGPALRQCKLGCHVTRKFYRILMTSLVGPLFESCGLVFSQIRIQQQQMVSSKDEVFEV